MKWWKVQVFGQYEMDVYWETQVKAENHKEARLEAWDQFELATGHDPADFDLLVEEEETCADG